jgi:hypothetical protein
MIGNLQAPRFSSTGRTALAAAALLLAAVPALAHGHGPYDGTWAPDAAASTHVKTLKAAADPNAPPAPPPAPTAIAEHLPVLNIHQGPDGPFFGKNRGPDFTFAFLDDDGSEISTTEVTTDGAENVNQRAGGALIHRSTSGYDADGAIRTTWRIEQPGGAVVISGTDRLEYVDGSTIRLTTETEDAKSTSRSVIIYRRVSP